MEADLQRLAKQPEQRKDEPQPIILQTGQVVQGHEIVKPLGKGKFSVVYMAKRLSDGLLCALKKINIFDMMQPKQREKCLKEVRLLQSLDHPNIVKLLEAIVDQNELLIIVDWAEKGDLKRHIRKAQQGGTRFKESQLWEYSRQLSGALEHMHRKRIMHRDLKPANIFISQDGSLKLGDLGLGREMSSFTLETYSKVGTPLYMSPQVLNGAGYDMKSDVWSLGCVVYELGMLRSPFKSDQQLSLYDLFVRINKGEYPPMCETFSAEFRHFVELMLLLDPSKRPDSAKVLATCTAHLQACAAGDSSAGRAQDGDAAASGSGAGARQRVSSRKEAKEEQGSPPPPSAPSKPSPLLVMDDIVEKLKLLDCEERLFRPRGYPILHRCFFVQQIPLPGELTQFEVMYELVRWLLSLTREREELARRAAATSAVATSAPAAPDASAGPVVEPQLQRPPIVPQRPAADAAASARRPHHHHPTASSSVASTTAKPASTPSRAHVSPYGAGMGAGDAAAGGCCPPPRLADGSAGKLALTRPPAVAVGSQAPRVRTEDVVELTEELMVELHGRGLSVHSEATRGQLQVGYGEAVCFIVNELINQELIGRDFHFDAPAWACVSGADIAEEVDEEGDLQSQSAGSQAEEEASASDEEAVQSPRAGEDLRDSGMLESVHFAEVDTEAWQQEMERVRPKLRMSWPQADSLGDWRSSVETAKAICLQMSADLSPSLGLIRGLEACASTSSEQAMRLRRHEDRLNLSFPDAVAELVGVQRLSSEESERFALLSASVANLSQELAAVSRELETAKDDSANVADALEDQASLSRLKRSLQTLKEENRALAVRIGCVRHDLLQREARCSAARGRNAGRDVDLPFLLAADEDAGAASAGT